MLSCPSSHIKTNVNTNLGKLLLWLRLVEDPSAPMSLQKVLVLMRIKRYMKTLVQQELREIQDELGELQYSTYIQLSFV